MKDKAKLVAWLDETREARNLIKSKLRQAEAALSEAQVLAKDHGISFASDISPITQTYIVDNPKLKSALEAVGCKTESDTDYYGGGYNYNIEFYEAKSVLTKEEYLELCELSDYGGIYGEYEGWQHSDIC